MRGFSGFLNQSAFIQNGATNDALEKIQQRLSSKLEWDWTSEDDAYFVRCKEIAVKQATEGVKCLKSEGG